MRKRIYLLMAFLLMFTGFIGIKHVDADDEIFKNFKIVFDANGGKFSSGSQLESTFDVGKPINMPEIPTRDGYEFVGWKLGDKFIDFDKNVSNAGFDIVVYLKDGTKKRYGNGNLREYGLSAMAAWKEKKKEKPKDSLTIYFDINGGDKAFSPTSVESGEKINKSEKPNKDGYIFLGWRIIDKPKINADGDEYFIDFDKEVTLIGNEYWRLYYDNGSEAEVDNNVGKATLQAVYKEKVNIEVTFDTKGGTADIESQVVYDGDKIKKPEDPVKEGYVFDHWTSKSLSEAHNTNKYALDFNEVVKSSYNSSTNSYYMGTVFYDSDDGKLFFNTKVGTKLELLAVYKKTVNFKVEFDPNGGSPRPDTQYIEKGKAPKYPTENPKKDGYVFDYWAFEDGMRAPDFSFIMVKEDLKLKAMYKKSEGFNVKFNTLGGSPVPDMQVVKAGEKAVKPQTDPVKDGYEFIGWYDSKTEYDFNEAVNRDIIIYAKYSKEGSSNDRSNRRDIDIDDDDYDDAIIKYHGILFKGFPDGSFKPEDTITRAQMVTLFVRLLGLEDEEAPDIELYSDIKGHWAEKNIIKLNEYGLLSGYPDGTFKPSGKMKRGQIAAIINKYWSITGFEPNIEDANIADIENHWAKELILALYNHRFVDLYSDNTFRPSAPLKRCEVAQIINRITDRLVIESDNQIYTDVPISHWAFEEINAASSVVEN